LNLIDLIIVVGDNETLMKVIRFYNLKNTPPILGIGNGCSPGIYNYLRFQTREAVTAVIQRLRNNSLYSQKLMKLNCNNNCETVTEAVCQLEIHRDMKEPIIILNLYLENE
jgi:NAD kinase